MALVDKFSAPPRIQDVFIYTHVCVCVYTEGKSKKMLTIKMNLILITCICLYIHTLSIYTYIHTHTNRQSLTHPHIHIHDVSMGFLNLCFWHKSRSTISKKNDTTRQSTSVRKIPWRSKLCLILPPPTSASTCTSVLLPHQSHCLPYLILLESPPKIPWAIFFVLRFEILRNSLLYFTGFIFNIYFF